MSPDLLQPLQIFSQLVIQTVGEDLKMNTKVINNLTVSIKENVNQKLTLQHLIPASHLGPFRQYC